MRIILEVVGVKKRTWGAGLEEAEVIQGSMRINRHILEIN